MVTVLLVAWVGVIFFSYKGIVMALEKANEL